MIGKILSMTFKGLQWACVMIVVLVVALATVLILTGAVDRKKAAAAFEVLRGRVKEEPPPVPVGGEWRDVQRVRDQMEATHQAQKADLAKLQDIVQSGLAQLETDRKQLEARRVELDQKTALMKKMEVDLQQKKKDRVMEANLPIYQEMEVEGLLGIMASWDAVEIVKVLRLMDPAQSAKVLEGMRASVVYHPPSEKRVKGQVTRLEQVVAEMQRVP